MERMLYEASLNGDVPNLNVLIQEDPLILDRVSVTCFEETPLHIAALRGHFDFARSLLSLKPELATELDSLRRTPLHLASANGYTEIVRELLRVCPDVCVVRDKDGRTPLHLAAMKGRVEVIKELIKAPESGGVKRERGGETVLHLCVKYNRLEALKLLVEWGESDEEFVNSTDDGGDTILHVAAAFKQMETLKYLLSRSGMMKANIANALNKKGFTALDVLEQQYCSNDDYMEIRKCLQEAGGVIPRSNNHKSLSSPPLSPSPSSSRVSIWMKYLKYQGDWLEDARGTLMVVATVIATMAFQAGVQPPGGVWQDQTSNCTIYGCQATGTNNCTFDTCDAGTSVFAYADTGAYLFFLVCNTVSLMSSLSIILLLMSGFPLKNRVCMWLLTISMCLAVTFMALSYLNSVNMVTPQFLYHEVDAMYDKVVYTWLGLLAIVGVMGSARFLDWLLKRNRQFIKKKLPTRGGERTQVV